MKLGKFAGYKGYIGTIEYDENDKIYHGQLLGIRDMVGYHSASIADLYERYKLSVDTYLEMKGVNL